jgi:hypothetical protein
MNIIHGIIYQLNFGEQLIKEQGLTTSYSNLNQSYFRPNIDLIVVLFGFLGLLSIKKIEAGKIKNMLFFIIIILFGVVISYIGKLGSKQNRFALYLYIIMAFLLFIMLKSDNKAITNKTKFIFMASLIIIIVLGSINYNSYKPLNEKNINYLDKQVDNLKNYPVWYCGKSSSLIFRYLEKENHCSENSFEQDISNLTKLNSPIILVSDDVYFYSNRVNIINSIDKFEKSSTILYDKSSGTKILLPKK